MSVNRRGRNIFVSEQLLDGANIVTGFEKVGGKTVAEGVATGGFWYASSINGLFDGVLRVLFMQRDDGAFRRSAGRLMAWWPEKPTASASRARHQGIFA